MLTQDLTKTQTSIVNATIDFVEYVHSFYGNGGLYDMGATYQQICQATKILLSQNGINVSFDSLDRERVRDILVLKFQLKFPNCDNLTTEHIHQI